MPQHPPDEIIRKNWENYLGTSMNFLFLDSSVQAVGSRNLSGKKYNSVAPMEHEAKISKLSHLYTAKKNS